MTTPAAGSGTTWTVTGQTEYTQIVAGGNPVPGVNVFYSTAAGHTGHVFIPYAQYQDLGYVRARLNQAAAQMDAVAGLSGTVPAS